MWTSYGSDTPMAEGHFFDFLDFHGALYMTPKHVHKISVLDSVPTFADFCLLQLLISMFAHYFANNDNW